MFSLTLDIGREEETKSIVYEASAFTHMRVTTPFPILGALDARELDSPNHQCQTSNSLGWLLQMKMVLVGPLHL